MSDAQRLKDAVDKLQKANKDTSDKIKTAASQIRQVRREQAAK